jgi:UDP-N-acetylglucosamine 2-epimerase (non-hydrolysing)
MPEEINRIVTDQLSTLLFTPSREADENLLREGVKPEAIHFVGNVMIDSLVRLAAPARRRYAALRSLVGFDRYGLVTLHRPSNVDDPERFRATMQALAAISADVPLVFPVHPRTQPRLRLVSSDPATASRLRLLDPLGYVDFLALLQHAALVITDSGGIQEETTYLGIPCLTLRPNTERPLTTTLGSNILVGDDLERLYRETRRILAGDVKRATVPPLWDGGAGERIADILCAWIAAHA